MSGITPVVPPLLASTMPGLAPTAEIEAAAGGMLEPALMVKLQQVRRQLQNAARCNASLAAAANKALLQPGNALAQEVCAQAREMAAWAMADARHSLQGLAVHLETPAQDAVGNPADKDASGLVWGSHSDFYKQIAMMLGLLQSEWLSKYQDAMSRFLEFYQKFSDIMEKIKPEAFGDKGDIRIDFSTVYRELGGLMAEYGADSKALASFPSQEEAEAFIASLGLPGLAVSESGGEFHVRIDLTAVEQLRGTMYGGLPLMILDSAAWAAWVSAKDSNMEQIKHVSKVLGEKLSEMTQKFDNIVKILSSTIDKITEADMTFVNGL